MEMGKLIAKLRDAVPVCFMVDGVEVKRYKNIEIPDDLKKLEYYDFKLDVPVNGNITFQISFAPGVLPMEFPKERERRTRICKDTPLPLMDNSPGAIPNEEISAKDTDSNVYASDAMDLGKIEEESALVTHDNGTAQNLKEVANTTEVFEDKVYKPEAAVGPMVKEINHNKKAKVKSKKATETI